MKVYGAGLLSSAAELQFVMDGSKVTYTIEKLTREFYKILVKFQCGLTNNIEL